MCILVYTAKERHGVSCRIRGVPWEEEIVVRAGCSGGVVD